MSVAKAGSANRASKFRPDDDHYNTPREASWPFVRAAAIPGLVWEPACGDGAISKVLELRGFRVVSSDLHDRGYGESNMNFLNAECACDAIITNPPFRLASNFIERSAEKKVPFAMLTKSTFWHAEKRRRLFIDTGPMAVMAMTWRPAMSPERGQSATMDFIWTVWSSKPNKETRYIVERRP